MLATTGAAGIPAGSHFAPVHVQSKTTASSGEMNPYTAPFMSRSVSVPVLTLETYSGEKAHKAKMVATFAFRIYLQRGKYSKEIKNK